MTFATAATTLSFPAILATLAPATNAATIDLCGNGSNLVGTTALTTSVPPGFVYSAALSAYPRGRPVKAARVSFNSLAAPRFVSDNMVFGGASSAGEDW